jgi:hypothetical protein
MDRSEKRGSPATARFFLAALLLVVNFALAEFGVPLVQRLVVLLTLGLIALGGVGAVLHRKDEQLGRGRERRRAHGPRRVEASVERKAA